MAALGADATDIEREVEWRVCASNVFYWLETYWYIAHPAGRRLLKLRVAQRDILERWIEHRYTCLLKARQLGITTLALGYAVWLAFFHDDQEIMCLSRREDDAKDMLLKATFGIRRLPAWMTERGPRLLTDNKQELSWSNGSRIRSDQSKNDPARGMTLSLVIVDEWASLENAEDAWASIEPATDIGGRVIGLSTAKGYGDFFHGTYVKAKAGENQFHSIFHPWWAVPERDQAWYDEKARTMLPWILHQEYPRDDVEAFVMSGRSVFDVDDLNQLVTTDPVFRGDIVGTLGGKAADFAPSPLGRLKVWGFPDPMHRYVIGADTAEGLEHGDYSSLHVIDAFDGKVAATWHGHIAPDAFAEVIWYLGWKYGCAYVVGEANNHGQFTLGVLSNMGYPNIHMRTVTDEVTKRPSRKLGFLTHAKSKPIIIDGLAQAVRAREVAILEEETVQEMRTYVRDENGKMSGSPFDDRVISFALAAYGLQFTFQPEWQADNDDYLTFDWWVKHADAEIGGTEYRVGKGSVR